MKAVETVRSLYPKLVIWKSSSDKSLLSSAVAISKDVPRGEDFSIPKGGAPAYLFVKMSPHENSLRSPPTLGLAHWLGSVVIGSVLLTISMSPSATCFSSFSTLRSLGVSSRVCLVPWRPLGDATIPTDAVTCSLIASIPPGSTYKRAYWLLFIRIVDTYQVY